MFNSLPISFTEILDLLGTFAFAISGIRLASGKNIDWFGAFVVGLVTAIGGGTLRDLLLDTTPAWMLDPKYIATTAVALLVVIIFKEKIFRINKTLLLFDAIGLGLFTVTGMGKALALGFPIWTGIIMGLLTGAAGGVIRDIILNEIPHLFKRDIYALASVLGGVVFAICYQLKLDLNITELIAATVVIVGRILVMKYHLHLPRLILNSKDKIE